MLGSLTPKAGKKRGTFREVECGHSDRPHESRGMCGPCYSAWRYYGNREELLRASRLGNIKTQFGLSKDQYESMVAASNGLCAICCQPCKSGRSLAIDHDHQTGKVRGLLCGNCNIGIGHFQDDPDLMLRAAEYIRQHRAAIKHLERMGG